MMAAGLFPRKFPFAELSCNCRLLGMSSMYMQSESVTNAIEATSVNVHSWLTLFVMLSIGLTSLAHGVCMVGSCLVGFLVFHNKNSSIISMVSVRIAAWIVHKRGRPAE